MNRTVEAPGEAIPILGIIIPDMGFVKGRVGTGQAGTAPSLQYCSLFLVGNSEVRAGEGVGLRGLVAAGLALALALSFTVDFTALFAALEVALARAGAGHRTVVSRAVEGGVAGAGRSDRATSAGAAYLGGSSGPGFDLALALRARDLADAPGLAGEPAPGAAALVVAGLLAAAGARFLGCAGCGPGGGEFFYGGEFIARRSPDGLVLFFFG